MGRSCNPVKHRKRDCLQIWGGVWDNYHNGALGHIMGRSVNSLLTTWGVGESVMGRSVTNVGRSGMGRSVMKRNVCKPLLDLRIPLL